MCEAGRERGTHVLRLELVLDDERPHEHAEEQGEDGRAADAHPRDESDALVVEEEAEEGRHDDAADGREERGEGPSAHAVVKRQVRRGEAPVAASDVHRSAKYAQHRVSRRRSRATTYNQEACAQERRVSALPRDERGEGRTKKMGSKSPTFLLETVRHRRRNCSLVDVWFGSVMLEPSERLTFSGPETRNATGTAKTWSAMNEMRVL